MKATGFRVQNFRNIDDSGWITLDKVTAFVGRNESGKTALLKALHKFNPATPEPYDAQRDFPRDRYTRDYVSNGSNGGEWPACSVRFEIPKDIQTRIAELLGDGCALPCTVELTRYYDDSLNCKYDPPIDERLVSAEPVLTALNEFASAARRLPFSDEHPEQAGARRLALVEWSNNWHDRLRDKEDLRGGEGAYLLEALRREAEGQSDPATADMVEALQQGVAPVLDEARKEPVIGEIDNMVKVKLPVLIYFENYGILDSAIWLPRFLEDLNRDPNDAQVRTINAMFKHVGLNPADIAALDDSETRRMQAQGYQPSPEQIAANQKNIDERTIRLSSASNDISERFSDWWSQRRHTIKYRADGDYFRIWIADDLRPDVEIELESRSKGFQWFFSFYLVFLVESEAGHKDAILLLDEPGLHLHPTAQQELISFFEKLSEANQLAYTTHSPFLIDGEHLHRVRPVTEDNTGHSRITADEWPKDHKTIFPLQAAAGYAMIRGLFQHRKNVLVEGMSDFYYLHALSQQCARSERTALPDDIYITPCGGTKNVGTMASLFLAEKVRPLVLLDGDDAGRARHDALMKELYVGHDSNVLMLDEVLKRVGQEVVIEDIVGEEVLLAGFNAVFDNAVPLALDPADRSVGSLPSQIKAAANRRSIELPQWWKASVALHLVSSWAEKQTTLDDDVLDRAALLFAVMNERFGGQ